MFGLGHCIDLMFHTLIELNGLHDLSRLWCFRCQVVNKDWRRASPLGRYSVVRLFVRHQYSRRTALRIFLIFCMNVPYHKGKKRTRPFVRENSGSLIIHENVSKIMVFGHFFQDYWWDLPKNAHEYSLDGSLWHCIGCWVSSSLEVRYFAYWLSQYA